MGVIEKWKKKWAQEQCKDSEHPIEFWLEIADMLIEGRRYMKTDLTSPMFKHLSPELLDYLKKLEMRGRKLEKQHGMEAAYVMYEICVAELMPSEYPYESLRIWYQQEKKYYGDAMRIAMAHLKTSPLHGKVKAKISGFKIDRAIKKK